ncbi:NADH-quinone oxidoreductase subunit J [bacterium]|nr:NADH-quinone oxidoreductase subunit J [bacterium]RQV96911.1 MAG: NADH-quinone oxidoreductase subunit J [bacterium]
METILFTVLAIVSILAALLVVTSPSPVSSALYLVVTLFCLAGFYVLLAAPFVAAIQIMVYAGAVVVLILFVIMLLNLQQIEEKLPVGWRIAGLTIAGLTLLIFFMMIMKGTSLLPPLVDLPESFGTTKQIGTLLFSKYLYAFEVISILLLLAMIGAVAIIRKPTSEGEIDAD